LSLLFEAGFLALLPLGMLSMFVYMDAKNGYCILQCSQSIQPFRLMTGGPSLLFEPLAISLVSSSVVMYCMCQTCGIMLFSTLEIRLDMLLNSVRHCSKYDNNRLVLKDATHFKLQYLHRTMLDSAFIRIRFSEYDK
jgi:hypothetical protein